MCGLLAVWARAILWEFRLKNHPAMHKQVIFEFPVIDHHPDIRHMCSFLCGDTRLLVYLLTRADRANVGLLTPIKDGRRNRRREQGGRCGPTLCHGSMALPLAVMRLAVVLAGTHDEQRCVAQ